MKIFKLTILTALAFVIAIEFALFIYILNGGDTEPAPTISKTWTYKPANFISRQVVISGSLVLMIVHVALYYKLQNIQGSSAMLFMALIANSSLAVVSAVCMDDKSAECLGSETLHTDFAVTYFILIDIWMCIMQAIAPARSHIRNVLFIICLGLAFFYTVSPNFSLGVFEYSNVYVILLFMISTVQEHLTDTNVGVLNLKKSAFAPPQKLETYLTLSNASITAVSLTLGLSTIGLAYLVAVSRGDFQPFPYIPELSDLFVLPPGNSLAHLGGVLGSSLLFIVMFQFYQIYSQWTVAAPLPLAFSLLATFGLSMSVCVSKVEDTELHFFLVSIFFAAFQVFSMWITFVVIEQQTIPKPLNDWLRALNFFSFVTKFRFIIVWGLESFAVWELLDSFTIIVFIGAFAWFQAKELKSFPLAIYDLRVERRKPSFSLFKTRKHSELIEPLLNC
jgi:hypothetical protein